MDERDNLIRKAINEFNRRNIVNTNLPEETRKKEQAASKKIHDAGPQHEFNAALMEWRNIIISGAADV